MIFAPDRVWANRKTSAPRKGPSMLWLALELGVIDQLFPK